MRTRLDYPGLSQTRRFDGTNIRLVVCDTHAGIEMILQRKTLLGLLVLAVSLRAVTTLSTAPSITFVEVRPKLWRYNGEFAFLPSPAARTPVAVWLVEVKSFLILIDTGAASSEYREPFLEALKKQLSSLKNPLRLVLCKLPCSG